MNMPSAVLIEGKFARHLASDDQTWSQLKTLLS